MVVKLELAAKSQALRLVLRAGLFATGVFWVRTTASGFWPAVALITLFSVLYFRPALNANRFVTAATFLLAFVFLLPPVGKFEIYLIAGFGAVAYALFGVKNLIFIRRYQWYYAIHFILFAALIAYMLFGAPGVVSQLLFFVASFLLLRELYVLTVSIHPQKRSLIAATGALVAVELSWGVSLLPINFLAKTALVVLALFAFHDIVSHHFRGILTREVVIKNAAFLAILFIFIVGFSQ